eukprot:3486821-Alexandrium_andersonii.AAC.1
MYAFDNVGAPAGPPADPPLPVRGVALPGGPAGHSMERLEALLAPVAAGDEPVGAPGWLPLGRHD